MKKHIAFVLLILLVIGCTQPESVPFELPAVISSGMVLQRNSEVNLWGKAGSGQKIEITTSWGVRKKIKTDRNGNWITSVRTGDAGGPYEIAFRTSKTSLLVDDILFGEVWLCSGQSNMEMPLEGWPPTDSILHAAEEIAGADYSGIRFFTVQRFASAVKGENCGGEWQVCTPESAADFSATAYFFGRKIHTELNVPVGLINSSWGGTPAEAWVSSDNLKLIPAYSAILDSLDAAILQYNELQQWMQTLQKVKINTKDAAFFTVLKTIDQHYAKPAYDDSGWPLLPVPSLWEANMLPNFDGVVWMRYTFDVPKYLEGKDLVLFLGPVDDMDRVFLNGEVIGETLATGMWRANRVYTVPGRLVKSGENVLTACVIDLQGGGGIYGSDDIKLVSSTGKEIILNGLWRYLPIAEVVGSYLHFFDDEKPFEQRPFTSFPINQNTPTALFNAMINPLIPYTIRGVIWYQGESNVGRGFEYRTLFPALIADWRNAWKLGDFPFYYVQIAPWEYGDIEKSPAAELREAQLLTLTTPKTGMVVTTDIGNTKNIHPSNKQEVGRRLALWALANDYGFENLVYSGPIYDSLSIDNGKVSVFFKYAEGGLEAINGQLTCFEIAGDDRIFHDAFAIVAGNTVEVSAPEVPNPVAVRFGWSATAEPNLFNTAGLPASPFRSDSWKRLTE